MSRRPQKEYRLRPIAASAAEIPYRSFQAPRAASAAGLPQQLPQHGHPQAIGNAHFAQGPASGSRPRQRITSGGNGGQTTQSEDRDEGQRSSNDSSGGQGSGNSGSNSNSTNTKSSTSTNPSTTSSANISTASATSLLSTATTPAPHTVAEQPSTAYYPSSGSIVSYAPPFPSNAPPLQFDALVAHVAKTRGMPEPGLDYFYARRVLWLLPPPIEPRPVSPSPSRIKLEALLNQPGAVESEEVWKAGLKNVWKGLVGGNQLRKRLPLSIVLKILQAGWLRDGTWPEGMVAPSWDAPPSSAAAAAHSTANSNSNIRDPNSAANTLPSLPPITQEYPYYPYPSRVGAAYSGSPSSGDPVQSAEQAALQAHYAQQYGYPANQAYPSSRPPTEPPTSGTPEPSTRTALPQAYDDGFAGVDDPEGDVDDDGPLDDDDEIDEPRYNADDGRHEGG